MSSPIVSKPPALQLRGVGKTFFGVVALKDVELNLYPGEVHALMGQNGAGKSTLIKVLTGVYERDTGEMTLDGRAIHPTSPLDAQKLGISTVYQEVNLCTNLTVSENVFAGRYPKKGPFIDWNTMHGRTVEILRRLNIRIDVTQLLGAYPVAIQQMVAIARALSVESRVLILDEPTSSLDQSEVQRLFGVLRQLRDEGMAILFVTHFLDQVYALSDRITVLRNGELVGEYLAKDLPAPRLVSAMVGRDIQARDPVDASATQGSQAEALLQLEELADASGLSPINLTINKGEVLGLGGLLGSGRTELAKLLFGLSNATQGRLLVDGKPRKLASPAEAIRFGMGLCPEDRKADGIVADLSVRENIVLALQGRQGAFKYIPIDEQRRIADMFIRSLGIKTANMETPIGKLSGGNQQKALLARWLATQPSLLILDEPTRGIDVAAKQEIMDEITRLAQSGMSVLFISSEIEEVVRVSGRVAVMRDRRKVGELPGGCSEQHVYQMIAAEEGA